MTVDKLTTALLQRAAAHAARGAVLQGQLTRAFNLRYGTTYSDVDCDELIDILDYEGGHLTLAIADRAMEASGAPVLARRQPYEPAANDGEQSA